MNRKSQVRAFHALAPARVENPFDDPLVEQYHQAVERIRHMGDQPDYADEEMRERSREWRKVQGIGRQLLRQAEMKGDDKEVRRWSRNLEEVQRKIDYWWVPSEDEEPEPDAERYFFDRRMGNPSQTELMEPLDWADQVGEPPRPEPGPGTPWVDPVSHEEAVRWLKGEYVRAGRGKYTGLGAKDIEEIVSYARVAHSQGERFLMPSDTRVPEQIVRAIQDSYLRLRDPEQENPATAHSTRRPSSPPPGPLGGPFEAVRRAFRKNPPGDDVEWAEIVEAAQRIQAWAEAGAAAPSPQAVGGITVKMLKAELNRKRGRDQKTGYETLRAPDMAAFIKFSWAADPSGKTAKFMWRKYVNLGSGERGKKHRATRLSSAGVGRDGVLEPAELAKILREAGTQAAPVEPPPPVPAAEPVPVGAGQIVAYGATSKPWGGGPITGADVGYDPCDSFTVVVTGEDLNPDYVATEEYLLKIPARAVPVRPGMITHGVIEQIVPQGDSYAVVVSTTQWVAMPIGLGRSLDRVFSSAAATALAVSDTDMAVSYRFDGLEDTPAAHEWVAVFTGQQVMDPAEVGDEPDVQVGGRGASKNLSGLQRGLAARRGLGNAGLVFLFRL